MDDNKYKELLQTLSFFDENSIPIDLLYEQINPNYFDFEGNNYLHYLSRFTFKEYYLNNNNLSKNEIIKEEKYKFLLESYLKKISSYVNILKNVGCDFFSINKNEEIPLELCLIRQNFYLAKEYIKCQQSISYIFQNNILNKIFSFGNFTKEYFDFLSYILIDKRNNIEKDVLKNYLQNVSDEDQNSLLVSFFRGYNQNIYNKFNLFLKINSIKYLYNKKGENIISSDKETITNIKNKSIQDLNDFCFLSFYKIINSLMELGVELNYIEHLNNKKNISPFMYLMAYPVFPHFKKFIIQNNINVNYKDYLGRTPLIHLINNKNNIINISKKVYDDAFKELINNTSIDLSIRDNNEISAFILCLINDYFEEAKLIYNKINDYSFSEFNLDIILLFIIRMNINKFDISLILNLKNIFNDKIDLCNIDNINKRTLLHYLFMFSLENFDNFINIMNNILKIVKEHNKKDIFNRNCLFYLFIDCFGDPKKIQDPYNILEYCLKNKIFNIDINENDIFGNNLLFYSIKGGFFESLKILIKYGAYLNDSINNEGNTIYTTSLMVNDNIFLYLYNLSKDPNILNQKVYKIYNNYNCFINCNNEDNNIIKDNDENMGIINMYEFFHNPDLILSINLGENKSIQNTLDKEIENNNLTKNKIINEIEEKQYISDNNLNQYTLLNLQSENNINIINKYYKENLYFEFKNPIRNNKIKIYDLKIINIKKVLQNPNNFINLILNQKKFIISDNLSKYYSKNNKNSIIDIISNNNNSNLISVCIDLLKSKKFNELIDNLNKIINEYKDEKLINLTNKEGQNIFHILSMIIIENNDNIKSIQSIYNKLDKYKIDKLFDSKGNTPMYYACKNLNKKFIEIYSNFNFEDSKNINFNSSLFVESENDNTPLEQLYKKINLEDNKLLTLIIQVSLKEKKGYLLYVLNYLIDKYKSSFNNIFKNTFLQNLSNSNYLNKIIGLYQYLINELKYNIMIEDNDGYDPSLLCAINNNYDFLIDILLNEKNKEYIIKNSKNKEGKSVIHLLIESKTIKNKDYILIELLNKGFCFNIKDNKGFYPIDYAYFNKEKKIVNILKDKYYKEGLPLKINSRFNFYKDSDILYNESIFDSSKYQKCDDLYGLVYSKFKYSGDKIHKVCIDNESIPYNVSLLRGNVLYHEALINKYIMQIIEDTQNKIFIVATIEKDKKFNEYKYNSLYEAEIKFKELFKEKTDNNWDLVKKDKTKFKTNYKKYYFFDFNFDQENDIYDYLKIAINNLYIKKNIKFNGNKEIINLIYYLVIKAYNNRFNNDNNDYNEKELNKNIENKTREIIINYKKKGMHDSIFILYDIEKILKNPDNITELDKKRMSYLIYSYLELIPFSIYNMNPNILNSVESINEEMGRITTYYYIENVLKIFLGAIKNLDEIHPLDYIINSLGCDIVLLEEETEEKIYIKNFLSKGGARKIKNIFKIKNSINDINFNPNNFTNRYIFCHGTKSENILGILSQGLKIAPVQAEISGNRYGDGIYLSDSYNVSINYSKKTEMKTDRIFILLVEAALGKENKDYVISNKGFIFNKVYMTEEGYGILNLNSSFEFGKIIVVKNEMNVRVKYIVEI